MATNRDMHNYKIGLYGYKRGLLSTHEKANDYKKGPISTGAKYDYKKGLGPGASRQGPRAGGKSWHIRYIATKRDRASPWEL